MGWVLLKTLTLLGVSSCNGMGAVVVAIDLVAWALVTFHQVELELVKCTELVGAVLASVPMVSIRAATAPTLSFRVGNKVALLNDGALPLKLIAGTLCCAFGKGKFGSKADEASIGEDDKELLFSLADSSSHIIMNNVLTTVGEALKLKRETMPLAEVNYHDITDNDGATFKLKRKHHVVFIPQATQTIAMEDDEGNPGGGATLQASAAALVPAKLWETHCTKLVWSMTWKSKGLMPIRPQIVFMSSGDIGPGQALVISG
jgi:hypothetical protein